MKLGQKFAWPVFGICLLMLSGCATTTAGMAGSESEVPAVVVNTPPAGDPVELAILSAIPDMKPGERGTAGLVAYVVKSAYTAASGARCKSVTVTQKSFEGTRVACSVKGRPWVFSSEVFLAGSDRD